MKRVRRIFLFCLVASLAAYVASAFLVIPGFASRTLQGSLLHPTFGTFEALELSILSFGLVLLTARRLHPLPRAALMATGFVLLNLALFIAEARLQHHGLLAETIIARRYGSETAIFRGAAILAAAALALAAAAHFPARPPTRKRPKARHRRSPKNESK
ncbi:hypothetical protein BH23VER1_BH23VER1_31580 [soil metagenome]